MGGQAAGWQGGVGSGCAAPGLDDEVGGESFAARLGGLAWASGTGDVLTGSARAPSWLRCASNLPAAEKCKCRERLATCMCQVGLVPVSDSVRLLLVTSGGLTQAFVG